MAIMKITSFKASKTDFGSSYETKAMCSQN